jgi:hypothetical protein
MNKFDKFTPCLFIIEVDGRTGKDLKVIDTSFPSSWETLNNLKRSWQQDADAGRADKVWKNDRRAGASKAYKSGNHVDIRIGFAPFSKD